MMPSHDPLFLAECACGQVAFEGSGRPMVTLACYCDDCQSAAQQIDALPGGRSGASSDGGTMCAIFRRDRVRCVRGADLLLPHKLRAASPTTRILSACCHCSMTAQFDNWLPHVPLRSHAAGAPRLMPQICIFTKYAREPGAIVHQAPRYRLLAPGFALKLALATAQNLTRGVLGSA
ncbi:MAG: hypothetical protein JWN48_4337 [Myxococcaceae bacterium]|nr:hypothetical protein [Myxococcaceae bacterium]